MNKFSYPLLAAVTLTSCQHSVLEPLHPIPMVSVRVESPKEGAGKSEVLPSDHRIYLYPQFDYAAETIVLDAVGNTGQVALFPGNYKVVLHSLPLAPLVLSGGESFETAYVSLPADPKGKLPSCPTLYALRSTDVMKTVGVTHVDQGKTAFVFNPMLVTKRLKITINASNFGNILSVHGSLTGVASGLNLHTLKADIGHTIEFDKVTVKGDKLTFDTFCVLGFIAEKPDDVVLTLLVGNDEVDFKLVQSVDLTEEIKKTKEDGGDVDISIDLKFNPYVRIHPVTIRQWDEAGNELELGFK